MDEENGGFGRQFVKYMGTARELVQRCCEDLCTRRRGI